MLPNIAIASPLWSYRPNIYFVQAQRGRRGGGGEGGEEERRRRRRGGGGEGGGRRGQGQGGECPLNGSAVHQPGMRIEYFEERTSKFYDTTTC